MDLNLRPCGKPTKPAPSLRRKSPKQTAKTTDAKTLASNHGKRKTQLPTMKLVHREYENQRGPWGMYFPSSQHIHPRYRLFAQQMLCILGQLRELPDDRVFCFDTSHFDLFLTTPGRWPTERFVGICMHWPAIGIIHRPESGPAGRAQTWVNMEAQSTTEAVAYFLLAIEKSGAATKCLAPRPNQSQALTTPRPGI